MEYGYKSDDGKWRLSHQLDTLKPNSRGLILELDAKNDLLKQNFINPKDLKSKHLCTWKMEILIERLMIKHNETFWVNAIKRGQGNDEEFHYISASHTKKPIPNNFYTLLETGVVTHDFTLSIKNKNNKTVRDHGYLFKIQPSDIESLIPLVGSYDLKKI